MIILGTRPEAIKLAPLILNLREDKFFEISVISTGQHREMLHPILTYFDIRPDMDLNLMSDGQTLNDLLIRALTALQQQLLSIQPDAIIVQGDTLTAMAASVVGFLANKRVFHLEAGLRTGNLKSPWPEEFNRRVSSLATDLHFAPTESNKQALISEGFSEDRIFTVGNTVVDALKIVSEKLNINPDFSQLPLLKSHSKKILVTYHRRENIGDPLRQVALAIQDILTLNSEIEVIWPLHKNPAVRKIFFEIFKDGLPSNLIVIEPLNYVPFIQLMKISDLILTDSGGVQEEAPFLGKPVLVLRETTERQESVNCGNCQLIGSDRKAIFERVQQLLSSEEEYKKMSQISYPYGDGTSSEKIKCILKNQSKTDL